MNFHIPTLFSSMVVGGLETSITGRVMESRTTSVEAIDIRDYPRDKCGHVDGIPYGGDAGMVMQLGSMCEAYETLRGRISRKPRLIYMTPQDRVFNQTTTEELAKEKDLVLLCGHHEGIGERALGLIVMGYLPMGDYVLTGRGLPTVVMIGRIPRLAPGVLNNDVLAEEESFHGNLLEYPQYTRPEVFRGMEVPEVLLGDHHKNTGEQHGRQSIKRTLECRLGLLGHAALTMKGVRYLDSLRQEEGGLGTLEELIDQYVKSLSDEASTGRTRRKATIAAKKSLAEKTCTVGELQRYFKVAGMFVGG